jgi:hypothetical protein
MADPIRTAADLIAREFGVRTRSRVSAPGFQAGLAVSVGARQAPNRLSVAFINLSLNVIYLAPGSDPSATHGFRLGPSGGALSFWWREDTHLVAAEWRIIATGANSDILVVETLILDPREA